MPFHSAPILVHIHTTSLRSSGLLSFQFTFFQFLHFAFVTTSYRLVVFYCHFVSYKVKSNKLVWPAVLISTILDCSDKKEHSLLDSPDVFMPAVKRARPCSPPLTERVMLYVRQDSEDVYTPLHVAPPTTQGLLHAVSFPTTHFTPQNTSMVCSPTSSFGKASYT